MKTHLIGILLVITMFCQNRNIASENEIRFSYTLLSKDTLACEYINLSKLELNSTTSINVNKDEKIINQKFEVDRGSQIYFYKNNFSGVDKLTKNRDAVELYGRKMKIDSLYYGKEYFKKPYIFASLINVAKFSFKNKNYVAFFIQDLSNPVTSPNTLLLLFDVTNKNDFVYIPIGFQASEDLKCINDFNKDGILDFAKWTQGYDFQKHLYRYELNNNSKFIIKKGDYMTIDEKVDGYYVDIQKSNWRYGIIGQ